MDREAERELARLTREVAQLRERINRSYGVLRDDMMEVEGVIVQAPFIVAALDAHLEKERALAAGWGITLHDSGPNANFTVSVHQETLDGEYAAIEHQHHLNDLADVDAGAPEDGDALVWDADSGFWMPGASARLLDAEFHVDGALVVTTDVGGVWVAPNDGVIVGVYLHCQQTGSSGTTIVDVNKNGTTIFTIQGNRPALAAGTFPPVAIATPDITTLQEQDVLSVDIDQVATGASGLSLTVAMESGGVGGGGMVFSVGYTITAQSFSDAGLEESPVEVE